MIMNREPYKATAAIKNVERNRLSLSLSFTNTGAIYTDAKTFI